MLAAMAATSTHSNPELVLYCGFCVQQPPDPWLQAISKKTKLMFQRIYNWQFINCLELWSALLIAHGTSSKAPLTLTPALSFH